MKAHTFFSVDLENGSEGCGFDLLNSYKPIPNQGPWKGLELLGQFGGLVYRPIRLGIFRFPILFNLF